MWTTDPSTEFGLSFAALDSSEDSDSMDVYHLVDVIKALQDDPDTIQDDLFQVEWAYLPILDGHKGAHPKLLESRLTDDPDFFCKVIRTVFRSKTDGKPDQESTKQQKNIVTNVYRLIQQWIRALFRLKTDGKPDQEPTEQQKNIATNAYRLLQQWSTPPGTQNNETCDAKVLTAWLKRVKMACAKSGHLEVALTMVGKVLIHTPSDPSGLWIHHSAAAELNAKDAKDMRDGFRTELFNSRPVHGFTAGLEEQQLAESYRTQADEVEAQGYHRLAKSVRELASSYERDAEREAARDPFDD